MINNNLKFCRENEEMTQTELGYIFGVHKSTVSGWETAKDTMPLKKIFKFSKLFNYSLDFITGLNRKNIEYTKIEKLDPILIGNNLKKLRKSLNMTQQQMAKECNISQTCYSGYESGRFLINTITIYTICKKYNISMDLLIGKKKKDKNLVTI